jgi:hypothetical protein
MIQPSIGRIVWFWPQKEAEAPNPDQPNAALVVYVWDDRMVNLAVFDSNGNSRGETSVTLLQDDDVPNAYGRFASWVPYQKGQAAKAESLEKQLSA